ncbi:MAG: N-acetyltransferase [Isosphaera sp.]|nr:N-acetyltransferase [Isosphaera sp.]
MLRPVTPADTDALVALAAGTGFFRPAETDALREVLDDYHAANADLGHRAFAWPDGGGPAGFVYHAPAAMTDRTWYVYWIAVEKGRQGRGLGAQLLAFAEQDARAQGGRLVLIETSTTPLYDPTRRFYLKNGYSLAAIIPDFYADGDGMAVFSKRVSPVAS